MITFVTKIAFLSFSWTTLSTVNMRVASTTVTDSLIRSEWFRHRTVFRAFVIVFVAVIVIVVVVVVVAAIVVIVFVIVFVVVFCCCFLLL